MGGTESPQEGNGEQKAQSISKGVQSASEGQKL